MLNDIKVTLHNGDILHLIEDTFGKTHIDWLNEAGINEAQYLGIFYKGEIDFEVKEEWVERVCIWGDKIPKVFKDYVQRLDYKISHKDSFLSLLQSLTSPEKKYVILLNKK